MAGWAESFPWDDNSVRPTWVSDAWPHQDQAPSACDSRASGHLQSGQGSFLPSRGSVWWGDGPRTKMGNGPSEPRGGTVQWLEGQGDLMSPVGFAFPWKSWSVEPRTYLSGS